MTCIEKYMQEHPDKKEDIFEVISVYCPVDFGIMSDPDDCIGDSGINCLKCWMREIPETTKNENKKENEEMCYTDCADVAALKKEIEQRDKEIAGLKTRISNQESLIKRKDEYLVEQVRIGSNVQQTNENLANELASVRTQLDMAKREKEDLKKRYEDLIVEYNQLDADTRGQDEEIDKLVKENRDLTKALEEKVAELEKNNENCLKCVAEYFQLYTEVAEKDRRIEELEKKIVDEHTLKAMRRVVMNCTYNPYVRPISELPYHKYAHHIHMKYKSLVDSGFSHDDAMSLIPMWDD